MLSCTHLVAVVSVSGPDIQGALHACRAELSPPLRHVPSPTHPPGRVEEVLEFAVEDPQLLDERLAVLLAVRAAGNPLQQQLGGHQVLRACTAVQLVLNRVLDLLL